MTVRYWLGLSVLAATAIGFSWGLLVGPPTSDSWMALWSARELEWWRVLTEPLAAGYAYAVMFEPLFVLAHALGDALAPVLGNFAYHLLGLVGLLLGAERLARLVWYATGSTPIALSAAAVFLAAPTSWFAIGETSSCHYTTATWLALCSIEPAWRAYTTKYTPARAAMFLSALAYAFGLGCKPSVAAIPLLIFTLLLGAGWRVTAAVIFVVPHAVALAAVVAWQAHILGGFGGYPFTPFLVLPNLIVAPLALSAVMWGHVLAGIVLALAGLALRPKAIWLWLVAALASLSPFLFAYPMGFDPYTAAKLLLPLAVFLLLLAWSGNRAGGAVVSVVAAALILLQWPQHAVVRKYIDDTIREETEYRSTRESLAVLSPGGLFIAYAWGHQLQPEPKGPLLAFFTPEDAQLYRAVEGGFPPGARLVGVADLPAVEVVPLSLTGIEIGTDDSGHVHLELGDGLAGSVWQAFLYQNGKTRFLYSWPVARDRASLPLNYSIRSVFLFRPTTDGTPWQVHRWDSPWFRDPYPSEGAHTFLVRPLEAKG